MTDTEERTQVGVEKTTTVTERPVMEAPTESEAEEQLARLLEGLGDELHKIYIFRREKSSKKWAYLAAWPPSEFSVEAVQEMYGGGDYRAQGRKGADYLKGRIAYFTIAGKPKTPDDDDDDDTARGRALTGAGIVTMRDLVELLAAVRTPPPAAEAGNPVLMATELVKAMQAATAPLQAALLDRDSGPDMESLLAVFEKGLEIGRGAGDNYGTVVDRFMPAITRLASLGNQPEAPAMLPPGAPPEGAPHVPGWVTAVRPFVLQLGPMAARNANPELYAEVTLDQASEAELLFLSEQINRGDPFRHDFYMYFPEAVSVRPWWDAFLDSLADGIAELEANPEPEGGGDGA